MEGPLPYVTPPSMTPRCHIAIEKHNTTDHDCTRSSNDSAPKAAESSFSHQQMPAPTNYIEIEDRIEMMRDNGIIS